MYRHTDMQTCRSFAGKQARRVCMDNWHITFENKIRKIYWKDLRNFHWSILLSTNRQTFTKLTEALSHIHFAPFEDRLILVGHSAGGCLALWAAHQLVSVSSEKAPLVLAAAPVADLVKAYEMKVSDEGPLAADQ